MIRMLRMKFFGRKSRKESGGAPGLAGTDAVDLRMRSYSVPGGSAKARATGETGQTDLSRDRRGNRRKEA